MSNLNLLGSLASAVKDLSSSFQKVSKIRGFADRVCELLREMKQVDDHHSELRMNINPKLCLPLENDRDMLTLRNVSVVAPKNGRFDVASPDCVWLAKDLSVTVGKLEHTVLRGPNGAGKSSLFRAIAGLWPCFSRGEGSIERPSGVYVVPQDAYFPLDSFESQVTYPGRARNSAERTRGAKKLGSSWFG